VFWTVFLNNFAFFKTANAIIPWRPESRVHSFIEGRRHLEIDRLEQWQTDEKVFEGYEAQG